MQLSNCSRNIIVIGASAGGVDALRVLFRCLPADLPVAFLVVLHIPPHSPSELARILSRETDMPVISVEANQSLRASTVYVASADHHLLLAKEGVRITRGPKECRVRPSIDVLFRSASVAYESRVIGVLLSGALDDGTAGLWAIKDRDGLVLVQDPNEATYDSMPRSAIQHVETDFIGTLTELADHIATSVAAPLKGSETRPLNQRHMIETSISENGNGLEAGVMNIGKISSYTCPDCHGVLVQIEEGSIVRFRCHTGHAFSVKTLIAEVNTAIDNGLWDTLRAVEERIMLLRQMGDLAEAQGSGKDAEFCRSQARNAEERLKPLRELVLDPDFFNTK
ncbi:chemotaxis protein CheB [Pseudomonas abietaniphila]|uniref:chemotaxis protein CheB n=1 Tax=Pseudomonas abietaniphila TaxID=89065 RepID=UPI000782E61A|nr:chemotaxis protein CheB [Pseudomonas abietaniphila]